MGDDLGRQHVGGQCLPIATSEVEVERPKTRGNLRLGAVSNARWVLGGGARRAREYGEAENREIT